jgi:hypothetical protein
VCKPLADWTIRKVHYILSGAFKRAVRWKMLTESPITEAEPLQRRRPILSRRRPSRPLRCSTRPGREGSARSCGSPSPAGPAAVSCARCAGSTSRSGTRGEASTTALKRVATGY